MKHEGTELIVNELVGLEKLIMGGEFSLLDREHDTVSEGYNELADFLINSIKTYFSSEGNEENIRFIYNKIKTTYTDLPKVCLPDMNKCRHIYNEYLEGMETFTNKVIHNDQSINQTILHDRIDEYLKRDREFITSTFENATKECVQTTVKDGVTNLEVLIDIIEDIENYKKKINLLESEVGSDPTIMELTGQSTLLFYVKMILSIIWSFQRIYIATTKPSSTLPEELKKSVHAPKNSGYILL